MARRVDIKYKNEFRHKCCFSLLFYQLNINCIDVRTNFGTKLVFRYLFCQSENSNCSTSHVPNSQLKIQIIAEYTQP